MNKILFEPEDSGLGNFPYVKLENYNLNFIAHYHKEVEVIYVEYGELTVFLNSEEFNLSQGDICVIMPGEIHSFQSKTYNNSYILKLKTKTYTGDLDLASYALENGIIGKKDEYYGFFSKLIICICEEYKSKNAGYEFKIRSLADEFVVGIIRYLPLCKKSENRNTDFLNELTDYLEKKYFEKISLDDISEYFNFSKYYFTRKIKSITGRTFIKYLSDFRLEKSIKLLEKSNASITEIAYKCGFGNLRSYNRLFLSKYMTTPLKYRKNNR